MNRLLSAAFFAAFATVTLPAQGLRVAGTIPFDFHACNRVVPSGGYFIDTMGQAVRLRDGNTGKNICLILPKPVGGGVSFQPARMVFARYGNDYFLRTIWDGTATTGKELPISHVEKELIAKNQHTGGAERTILALTQR